MNGLGALPRVRQLLVCRGRNVARDQRVHGLRSDISSGLTRARDLSDLSVEHSLFVAVDFKCSQNVNFLN